MSQGYQHPPLPRFRTLQSVCLTSTFKHSVKLPSWTRVTRRVVQDVVLAEAGVRVDGDAAGLIGNHPLLVTISSNDLQFAASL